MSVVPKDSDPPVKTQETAIDQDSKRSPLHERSTTWSAIWILSIMQFVDGLQFSVYYMSMWPYLSGHDKTADMDFLGWVVAACSLGCSISCPLYGYWNQKTLSCKWPTICGFLIAALGQVMYGAASEIQENAKWYMLAARLITGLGTGNTAVMKAYSATASAPKDRLKAISYGIAGTVLGVSFGPVISAAFTPIGEKGVTLWMVRLNMYTSVAYLMALICITVSAVMFFFFTEDYAGIIEKETHDEKNNSTIIVPKYDMMPALICIYLNMIITSIATNIEVISTPLTTVLYNWKDSDAILYNGILEFFACILAVLVNFAFAKSWIGNVDRRRQIVIGIVLFIGFNVVIYPWSFYPGPLDFLPPGMNTSEVGGCLHSYTWCSGTTRVPMVLYIFVFVFFFGIAFPCVESPACALYSEILGPRKQGTMQGLFTFGGTATPCIASILLTYLFQHSGYRYVVLFQFTSLFIALLLVLFYYNRLVPLKLREVSRGNVKTEEDSPF
ncbi:unnamed protein product [Caenorhabditis sp. 36 PRJEB53466]|nr:unnamed protein product [Caenorhabditis sp. 36 PRJEB53466]